jgi:hypothetical protein
MKSQVLSRAIGVFAAFLFSSPLVMAHEIGHVASRHGTRQTTKAELAQSGHHSLDLLCPLGWLRERFSRA